MWGTNSNSMYDCLPTSGFGAELYASSKIFISLRLRRDPVNPHTPLSACLRRTGSPTSQTLCSSLKTMIRTQKFARNIWGSNGSDVLQLLSLWVTMPCSEFTSTLEDYTLSTSKDKWTIFGKWELMQWRCGKSSHVGAKYPVRTRVKFEGTASRGCESWKGRLV
jgi:hypothetical protein